MNRKSVWLPVALLIYISCMTALYARDYIATGHSVRLWVTVGIEVAIIIALTFFLRKREKIGK